VLDDAIAIWQRDASRAALSIGYPSHVVATLRRRMAKVCNSCGKGPAFGQSRSHSMRATKRRFEPNLQKVRAIVDGSPRRVYVCTRCLKAGKVQKAV
jgi:large subunit ribosomal protein L28